MKNQPEHNLQVACVQWLRLQYPYLRPIFFAVPNGGYRTATTAAIMKSEGVNRGVSDLILDLPTIQHHGLRIEMKWKTQQSQEQKIYQQAVQSCGYKYVVIHSKEEFIDTINQYVALADRNVIARLVTLQTVIQEQEIKRAKDKLKQITQK